MTKNTEQLGLSLLMGIQNGTATLEHHLEVLYMVKYTLTIWPNNSIPRHIPKWNESYIKNPICKYLYQFYSQFPKIMKTIQMSSFG